MDPSLDFDLGENADMTRETTRGFAKEQIEPLAARVDAEDWFARDLWPAMDELGLHGITVAEEDGGLGLGYLEHVVAQEEVADSEVIARSVPRIIRAAFRYDRARFEVEDPDRWAISPVA